MDQRDLMDLDKNVYLALISTILKNKEEERELALDRYRKADEQMETTDEFAVMGRNAVSFLKLASDATNDLAGVASELKSIIFKDNDSDPTNVDFGDASKKAMIDAAMGSIDVKEIEKESKKKREEPEEPEEPQKPENE